jgi:predicted  nucleic acid-binding Zn-ribbon protein
VQVLYDKIKEHYTKYADKVAKTPNNKGANTMKDELARLWAAVDRYQKGKEDAKNVVVRINSFIKVASEYKTDDARRALADAKALRQALGGSEPVVTAAPSDEPLDEARQTMETAPAGTATREAESASATASKTPTEPLPVYRGSGETSVSTVIYLLFGVYFLAIVVIGVILSNAQKRSVKLLEEKIQQVSSGQPVSEDGSPQTGSSPEQLKQMQQDFGRSLENLEYRIGDSLQALEARLERLEKRPAGSATSSEAWDQVQKALQAQSRQNEALVQRLNQLEVSVGRLDRPVSGPVTPPAPATQATPTPPVPPAPAEKPATAWVSAKVPNVATPARLPYDPAVLDQLYDSVQTLGSKTRISTLEEYCTIVAPVVRQCRETPQDITLDLKQLGQLVQYAFVAAVNEKLDAPYEVLVGAVMNLGMAVLDQLKGEHPLRPELADSVEWSQYTDQSRYRTEEYPQEALVQADREGVLNSEPPVPVPVVLSVLRPTVVLKTTQEILLLAKGAYVVAVA